MMIVIASDHVKGWPVAIPTLEEAMFIAETRLRIADVRKSMFNTLPPQRFPIATQN